MHPSISNTPSASLSARLYQIMRDHQLTSFFLLAYAFSWLVTLPYVLSVWGVIKGDFIIGYMVNKWVGPALAATFLPVGALNSAKGETSFLHSLEV